jgi:hypothetical protein
MDTALDAPAASLALGGFEIAPGHRSRFEFRPRLPIPTHANELQCPTFSDPQALPSEGCELVQDHPEIAEPVRGGRHTPSLFQIGFRADRCETVSFLLRKRLEECSRACWAKGSVFLSERGW